MSKSRMKPPPLIHPLWSMIVPVGMIIILLVLEVILADKYQTYIVDENGLLEYLQFIVMFTGFILAVRIFLTRYTGEPRWLPLWIGAALLGCLYVAGEEVSWGQQIFKWATPDLWLSFNDQKETNLHNTSTWLDQKPRMILGIGVIVGGILLPLVRRFKADKIPDWLWAIMPPPQLTLTAALYVTVKIIDKISDATGFIIFTRASEVTELYIFYFVALYVYWLLLDLPKKRRKKN